MSRKNRLFKFGKTNRLRWDFFQSWISARFGKSAAFQPEPKSGTALVNYGHIIVTLSWISRKSRYSLSSE